MEMRKTLHSEVVSGDKILADVPMHDPGVFVKHTKVLQVATAHTHRWVREVVFDCMFCFCKYG